VSVLLDAFVVLCLAVQFASAAVASLLMWLFTLVLVVLLWMLLWTLLWTLMLVLMQQLDSDDGTGDCFAAVSLVVLY